jgi:hypothetical protein
MSASGSKLRLSPNCHYERRKKDQNRATPEKWNSRYLTTGKGIYLDFVSDSEPAISGFKTAGFNPSSPSVSNIRTLCDLGACL